MKTLNIIMLKWSNFRILTSGRDRSEFQSTNGCGLSQSGLGGGGGVFTLEANPGSVGYRTLV